MRRPQLVQSGPSSRSTLSAFSGCRRRLIFASVDLPHDLVALREEYFTHGLRRIDLDPDPIKQFGIWFTAAVEVGISEMNAIALATVAENGQPTTRMVLLKGYDHAGFVFYTNYQSEKGRHLEKNPRVGLVPERGDRRTPNIGSATFRIGRAICWPGNPLSAALGRLSGETGANRIL